MWPGGLLNAAPSKAETGSCSRSILGRRIHPQERLYYLHDVSMHTMKRCGLSPPESGWSAQVPSQTADQGLAYQFLIFFYFYILSHPDSLKNLSGRYSLDHTLSIPQIPNNYTLLLIKTVSDPSTRHLTPFLRS